MNDKFLKIAKRAAIEAGKIIQKYSGQTYQKNIKHEDLSDFATDADLEAEKKIVEILSQNFPGHNIIAEEGGRKDKGSRYTWVIDPLDGTFSFTHGFPYFAVSIGLLEENLPVLGVIYYITNNDLYFAQKDKGAYLNKKKIHVSEVNVLAEVACGLDVGHRGKRSEKLERYWNTFINKIGYPYSIGTAVVSQALVGRGILDGYVSQAWVWDFAAGTVIIREAGGRVTDFEGNEPDWTKERLEIVASNGIIHEAILKELQIKFDKRTDSMV